MNGYVRIYGDWKLAYVNRNPANFNTIYIGLRKSTHTLAVF
jgi:hypothetical protein